MENFRKLGISDENIYPILEKGFKAPTEIQELTIPVLLENNMDIIAQAQTGTGKTAAFGLPLIEKIEENGKVQALILAPTRELVIQVCDEINSLAGKNKLSVISIYGGQSIDVQFKKLRKGVSVVVGTPGRVLDHLKRGTLKLDNVKYFILDEADEMLNMGFVEDIETIFNYTPEDKRVLLFSATMPHRIQKLAENYMGRYKFIKTKTNLTTNLTKQIYYEVHEKDKFDVLSRIIDINEDFYGLIFCQTKVEVDRLANRLIERGYRAEGLHGDLSQAQRERTLSKFRHKHINVLIATDVAARGIDITDLTHVINYSVPQNPEIYVHRIGRTGRAGKQGVSITFVTPAEYGKIEFIKRIAKCDIKRKPLPKIEDSFKAKKYNITKEIFKIMEKSDSNLKNWAEELLDGNDPVEVVTAILQYSYGKIFDENNYKKLSKIVRGKDDKARLFFAKGKEDGMTKQKIVNFISEKAGTEKKTIERVEVYDNFSFITVSEPEAEVILHRFKNIKNGRRSIIERAKQRKRISNTKEVKSVKYRRKRQSATS